jgi:hypothetical protein
MEDQPHATALTKNEIIRSGLKQSWRGRLGKTSRVVVAARQRPFSPQSPEPSQSPLVSRVFRHSPNPSRRCSHSIRRALIHCSALSERPRIDGAGAGGRKNLAGYRWFESISLQQTVRLSPAATFERQEPGLSPQVCQARLTTGSAETQRAFHPAAMSLPGHIPVPQCR